MTCCDYISEQANRPITLPARPGFKIMLDVAAKHGLTLEELCSPSPKRRFAHPRQEAMWRMYRETRLSSPQIARMLNRKDHTTVLHGVEAYERRQANGA